MCAPLLIPGINNASCSGKICAITSIHTGVMKIRVNTGRATLFSRIISHISRASRIVALIIFMNYGGHGSLIRFYLRTKHKPSLLHPPTPPPPFIPHPPADFIQRGIIKLIVFRQCQKQYTIGYRVRFNRRNTTSIDASRDISIHRVRREFLKYPGIVNQRNIIFTK